MDDADVIVVGAGLAGLSCAVELRESGHRVLVIERDARVGGRIQTDDVDGFKLDRGFQVLLTAYPDARRLLDYEALRLARFEPGALIRHQDRFVELSDPLRKPTKAWSTLTCPVGTLADKWRILSLRSHVQRGEWMGLFDQPNIPTLSLLKQRGFSDRIIETFFRPFLGGIFLERDLETPSNMFEFVFRMFSTGYAAVPANGMQAIPDQLAARLGDSSIKLKSEVVGLAANEVELAGGEKIKTRQVVLAVDGLSASHLTKETYKAGRHVECLYFVAPSAPVARPILILNGEGQGPIGNLCFMDQVAASYAPAGKSLVSVSVIRNEQVREETSRTEVIHQLKSWFGAEVDQWGHLKTYRVQESLPHRSQHHGGVNAPFVEYGGIFHCGDRLSFGSQQHAIWSGRLTAEAVNQRLSHS